MDRSPLIDLGMIGLIALFATVWTRWGLEWWLKRGEDNDKKPKAAL